MNNLSLQAKITSKFNPTFDDRIASQKFLSAANRIAEKYKDYLFNLRTKRIYQESNGQAVIPKNAQVKIEVCKNGKWGKVGYFRPEQIIIKYSENNQEEEFFRSLTFSTEVALIQIGRKK